MIELHVTLLLVVNLFTNMTFSSSICHARDF